MITSYIVLNIVLIDLLLSAQRALKLFLSAHSSIENAEVLEELKNVARWNMYGALGFLILGGLILLLAFLLMRGVGFLGDLLFLRFPCFRFGLVGVLGSLKNRREAFQALMH